MCDKYTNEEVELLEAKLDMLQKEVELLKKRLNELEGKQRRVPNFGIRPSTNTSKIKKQGPKKGHKGCNRPIPDDVDDVIELPTACCPHCHAELTDDALDMYERYVEDIVCGHKNTKKYQIYRKYCPKCKKIVCEKPKDVLPRCRFGFNLMIFLVFYKYVLRLTLNKIQELLRREYELKISEGTIVNELHRFAEVLGPDFDKIIEEMKHEHYINADETGHRVNGISQWLWVFASKKQVLYLIRDSRGSKVPKEVLGDDFEGVVSTDFWPAYNWIKNQQKCWAHVLRKTSGFEKDYILHRRVRKIYRKAKKLESVTDYGAKKKGVDRLIKQVEQLRTIPFNTKEAYAYAKTLYKNKNNLFTFVFDEEVEATNNRGEQKIRPEVIRRKISGGNRSEKGARTLETNVSVIGTWDAQGKEFFETGMKTLTNFVSNG